MTVRAERAWRDHPRRLVRTERHPACAELREAGDDFESLDRIYVESPDLDTAYDRIVDVVLADAADGDVVYAVPGSPRVGEETVRRLLARAALTGVQVEVVEGVSFLGPVFGAVGSDPVRDGLVVVDAREPHVPVFPDRPVLVTQVDSALVLGDVKLALLETYAPDHRVAIVSAAGTEAEAVTWAELATIDHSPADPGHLACLWVPVGDVPGRPFPIEQEHRLAGRAFADLVALEDRLRSPGGCPWDAEQTHHSLAKHLVEECYEVLDALEALPERAPQVEVEPRLYAHLCEELGDHLYQAVFHARLAEEAGGFDASEMVTGIVDKLVRRHPHVFGDVEAESGAAVLPVWEAQKAAEKGRTNVFDGIPRTAPALVRAAKAHTRARSIDAAWDSARAAETARSGLDSLRDDLARGASGPESAESTGRTLLALARLAREAGVDPEGALRHAVDTWIDEQT